MPAIFPFQTTSRLLMGKGLSGRPRTPTNHSPGQREGEAGEKEGWGEQRGSIRTDHSRLPGEECADETARSAEKAFAAAGGVGSVRCWARGRRLAGQGPGWLTASHRDATRSQRPGLTATHLGLSGRPPWLSSSKDMGVLQISRGRQGFLSSDSSSEGLWGLQAGGNCSQES